MNQFDKNRKDNPLDYFLQQEQVRTEQEDVKFQLDNVSAWISMEKYEEALIKCRYLVEALEKIVNNQQ